MNPILQPYQLFLVDMDDTLFEERNFVLSGFRAVAGMLGQRGFNRETVWQHLINRFEAQGRDRIFNDLFDALGEKEVETWVAVCVHTYREHEPEIALYPGVESVLSHLRRQGEVIIVTDGLPAVQKRKYLALQLDTLSDRLICCWERNAPKPDPASLVGVVAPGQADAILIGDDPVRDLPLAAALEIDAIRVRTGRFRDVGSPYPPLAELKAFKYLL